MNAKHTAGTWITQSLETRRHGYDGWNTYTIRSSPANHCLAVVGAEDHATAAFNDGNARRIVQCVNAHDDLLEACKAIAALADGQGQANMMMVASQARAAIAKAQP